MSPVRFYAYCSKTRGRILVQALLTGRTLVWRYFNAVRSTSGATDIASEGETSGITGMDTTAFVCPCCRAGRDPASGYTTWRCLTCSVFNCMGTNANGRLRCGLCCGEIDPASLVPNVAFNVRTANARDF